jgi:hypothetical protein
MLSRLFLCGAAAALALSSNDAAAQPASAMVDIVANCGADPTGVADSSTAIQTCLNTAAGRIVFVPPGTFRVNTQLVFSPNQAGSLGPSLIMRGAGRYASVFDTRVAGPMLKIEANPIGVRFQAGAELSDFAITSAAPPAGSVGIYLRAVWQMYMRNVRVQGLGGDGVQVESLLGDPDAPVNVSFENCFFWSNQGYGLRVANVHTPPAPPPANVSFVAVRDSSFQQNAAGGMHWNGQQLHINNTGFATNSGTGGLLIKFNGDSPLTGANSQMVTVVGSTFENNVPRHLDIESLLNGYFAGNQFTSSLEEFFDSQNAIRIGSGPSGSIVRNVTFVNTTANIHPDYENHTFFDIGSKASETSITNTRWQRYDAATQTRFNDSTPFAVTLLAGLNHDYLGKTIRLLNASGHPMTLAYNHPGSADPNRIFLKGGTPVTVPYLGTATLIYDSANKKWWLLSTQ